MRALLFSSIAILVLCALIFATEDHHSQSFQVALYSEHEKEDATDEVE